MNGPRFTVGEEVLYRGRRYVIAALGAGPYGVRLLAAGSRHSEDAAIVHAAESDLETLQSYLQPRDDTYVA